jgi:CRISPR-associated protein Csb2
MLIRAPYPGYASELQDAYRDGRRAWEVTRTVRYAIRRHQPTSPADKSADDETGREPIPGPFEDLLVWGLQRPVAQISGGQVAMLTSTLRRAVLSLVPDPVPAQVSGHGAPDRRHVGYLALPDVGHEHADGHVLGLALAVPGDLPRADLVALLKAVIPLTGLRLPGGRTLGLVYGAGDRAGLSPEHWGGQPGAGSREWVTATPVMLDGHLRRGRRSEASEVARSLVIAGYPQPAEVEVSPAPLVRGGVWQPRPETLPSNRTHRRLVHARVTFSVPCRSSAKAAARNPDARATGTTTPHRVVSARLTCGQAPAQTPFPQVSPKREDLSSLQPSFDGMIDELAFASVGMSVTVGSSCEVLRGRLGFWPALALQRSDSSTRRGSQDAGG